MSSSLVKKHVRGTLAEVGTKDSLFLRFLKDKSEASAKTYRADLADLTAWITDAGQRPSEISDEQIATVMFDLVKLDEAVVNEVVMRYRTHLIEDRKCAPNTVNRRMAAIRSYVGMANILRVTTVKVHAPRLRPDLVRDVSGCGKDSYTKILKAAKKRCSTIWETNKGNDLAAARDYAILVLYHDAGLRRFEPLHLKYPEDVDLKNGRIWFRGKDRKGKSWFSINSRCVKAIKELLKVRGQRPGYLFYSTSPRFYGKPLTVRTGNKIVDKAAAAAGVRVTPHGLRHTAATTLLKETNGNVRGVAEFLRHSGLGIVQRYDDDRRDLARQMGSILDDKTEDEETA